MEHLFVSSKRHALGHRISHSRPSASATKCQCVGTKFKSSETPKVVCIGEGLFDMLANDKGKPKEEVSSWTGYPGGAPCNVACGLGKLGIPVGFVSCLGQDDRGDELMALMKSRGVDVSAVRRVPESTRDVYVVRKLNGERIFDSFGQDTNTYCDCHIKAENVPIEMLQDAKVVVMGTLGLAYPDTAGAMNKALEACKSSNTIVMIDVNWRPVFWNDPDTAGPVIVDFVKKADLVKITEEEAEWALGIPAADALKNPALVLEKLPDAKGVLVTAGGDGCSYCIRSHGKLENTGFVPVYNVDVQDTTGAGDAYTCGFLTYMLAQSAKKDMTLLELLEDPEETFQAVRFAAACGALTTLKPGAIDAQPDLSQVEDLVASSA